MDRIDLSVILAARNQAEYVATWLAHLEQQTYPAARFEILVVDDGSKDGTPEILERYAEGAPVRMRCIRQRRVGTIRARNLGIRDARGRIILFLDKGLLASPNLVERHIRAHEQHGAHLCVIGSTRRHPQLRADALTQWFLPEDRRHLSEEQPPHFLDWQGYNLSLPRRVLLDLGGFDEDFPFPEFDDAELASRLAQHSIEGRFVKDACGYIWLPVSIESERRRQYARGYSLYRLTNITESSEIFRRYSLRLNPLRAVFDAAVMPFYIRACQGAEEEDIRLFGRVYRRVLRHAIHCGYTDARKGRPPMESALQEIR